MQILNKFRNRFWFNTIAFMGLILGGLFCLILISLYILEVFFNVYLGSVLPIVALIVQISALELVVVFVAFVFYIIERIYQNVRITNKEFLNSKIIHILQNIGIFFYFIPITLFIVLLIVILLLKS